MARLLTRRRQPERGVDAGADAQTDPQAAANGRPRDSDEPAGGRRRLIAIATLAVAIGAVVAAVLIAQSSSPSNSSASNSSIPQGAATVQRRNLVQTDTQAGTLSYNNPGTVYNHLTGTLTSLPSVGSVIQPGGTLFRVNDQPVILMSGPTPAYRNLGPGATDGPDVYELNANLVALGFNPDGITVDDVWQSATTAGVEAWQASLGETQNGKITLGRIVFLPGPQKIATVTGNLGSSVSWQQTEPRPEFVSYTAPSPSTATTPSTATSTSPPTTTTPTTTTPTGTTPTGTTPTGTTPTGTTPTGTTPTGTTPSSKRRTPSSAQQLAALLALLRAETAQLNKQSNTPGGNGNQGTTGAGNNSNANASTSSKGSNGSNGSNPTGGGGAGTAVMTTTSTQLIVTVGLDASSQSEAVVGAPVTVQMPNGNTVNGHITAVSPVAVSSSSGNGNGGGGGGGNGNSGSATVPVKITLDSHVSGAGLDQASVSVNFAKASAKNVLSVPVTALLATAGGNYAVQEAAAPRKLVPVQTGIFAAGYVQISGPGIYPGLQVTDSQG